MKSIKQRLKKIFCKHEDELISETKDEWIFRCKKCGKKWKFKTKWWDNHIVCKL